MYTLYIYIYIHICIYIYIYTYIPGQGERARRFVSVPRNLDGFMTINKIARFHDGSLPFGSDGGSYSYLRTSSAVRTFFATCCPRVSVKFHYGQSRHLCDDPVCPDPVRKLSRGSRVRGGGDLSAYLDPPAFV